MKNLLFILPIICLGLSLQAQQSESSADLNEPSRITEDFFDAVRDRNIGRAIYFLDRGFIDGRSIDDVNVSNEWGETALHIAAENADMDMVEALWGRGARITKDEDGNTPLHMLIIGAEPMFDGMFVTIEALNSDILSVAGFLLFRGANPQEENNYGESPLSLTRQILNSLSFYRGNPLSIKVNDDPTEELLRLLPIVGVIRDAALRLSLLEQAEQALNERTDKWCAIRKACRIY